MGIPKANNSRRASKPFLFIVDDEPMLLELAAKVLASRYEIETFSNPRDALQAYTTADPRPELVVTDYAMPYLNGLEFIAELRRINPRQKIVLVSGTVDESAFANTEKPDRFLSKPYRIEEFTALVESVLAS